ncbi:WhiB family transcriptional regulator [Streptomyces sp. PKU-MA01144]|nr:WhiB family transcriptional regulator [Streptomyces sp. PKU-MA01144]
MRARPVTEWQDDALCAEVGTDLWFPEAGHTGRDAKEVCYRCPVRRECLTDAMREEHGSSHERRFGIRGGLGPRERIALEKGAAA